MNNSLTTFKISLKNKKGNSLFCPFTGVKLIEVKEFYEFLPNKDNCPDEIIGSFLTEGSGLHHPYPVENVTKGDALRAYELWSDKYHKDECDIGFDEFTYQFQWSAATMIMTVTDEDDWPQHFIVFQPKQMLIF